MSGPRLSPSGKVLLTLAVLLLWASSASAYVGPGAGLDLIPYALTIMAFALTAFWAVLSWPIYALLRRLRGKDKVVPPNTGIQEEQSVESSTDFKRG
ncbi:MAG TPA: hypothetical protein VE999_11355 [Gemmataceae bacterium]|nr:hypothetical protein [Gemmataceae bacterium]